MPVRTELPVTNRMPRSSWLPSKAMAKTLTARNTNLELDIPARDLLTTLHLKDKRLL